jgi:NhaP-type Na+/H+ or K+/H+ antiporter
MPLLTVFVLALFIVSLLSRQIERLQLTAPIAFTCVGLVGSLLLAHFPLGDDNAAAFLMIAELGLVVILFAEASHIDLQLLSHSRALPTRLLTVGMLLTIGLGLVVALVLFDELTVWHAGILAAVLAPTDAGLGQVIVTDKRVPLQIREALNVEAGLNDGLAVPFLLFFIAMSVATGDPESRFLTFIIEQLGYGAAIGLVVGKGGGWLVLCARERDWISGSFTKLIFLAMPLLCLQFGHGFGGSAFIAAFVAGLALPRACVQTPSDVQFVDDWGFVINLAVFFLFGVLIAANLDEFRPVHFVYGVLSLTVVRMVPVAIALIGSRLSLASVVFVGWFGPRGLASIVLGLVYYEHSHGATERNIGLAVMATVLISILVHGLTAQIGVRRYARIVASLPENAPERMSK